MVLQGNGQLSKADIQKLQVFILQNDIVDKGALLRNQWLYIVFRGELLHTHNQWLKSTAAPPHEIPHRHRRTDMHGHTHKTDKQTNKQAHINRRIHVHIQAHVHTYTHAHDIMA